MFDVKRKIRMNMHYLLNNLTQKQKYIASKKVTKKALNILKIKKANNIALFFSMPHEFNTTLLILHLLKQKKKFFYQK